MYQLQGGEGTLVLDVRRDVYLCVAGEEDDEHVPRLQVPVLEPKYAFLKQFALLVLEQLQVLPLLLVEEEADLEVIERFIHLLR